MKVEPMPTWAVNARRSVRLVRGRALRTYGMTVAQYLTTFAGHRFELASVERRAARP